MKFTVDMFTRKVAYARYEQAYFSEAFNTEIVKAVHLKERVLTEREALADGKERMCVRVVPHVALPGAIQKLVNDEIAYQEITVFDPVTRTATFKIHSKAGTLVQVNGHVSILEESDGVRVRFEGEANVKIFGLGGVIERFMVAEIKKRYGMVETAMQRFIDEERDLQAAV